MKLIDVFKSILGESLAAETEVEDVLMYAVVLHTHSIVLRDDVYLEDVAESERVDGRLLLAPLTRRHLATLIAECFSADPRRGSYVYWLEHYENDAPYELFEDVPDECRFRALAAKECIQAHPLVAFLVPE